MKLKRVWLLFCAGCTFLNKPPSSHEVEQRYSATAEDPRRASSADSPDTGPSLPAPEEPDSEVHDDCTACDDGGEHCACLFAVGERCSNQDALGCSGHNSTLPLLCDAGRWTRAPSCAASQRCDTRPGDTRGQCLDLITDCRKLAPGSKFCFEGARATCGPDRVSVDMEACESGFTCSSDAGDTTCIDINECTTNNGGCDPTVTCTNTDGSRLCGDCRVEQFGTGETRCQARFRGLGDLTGGDTASYVAAMSPAGDVAVGWSRDADGDHAIRWDPDTGLSALDGVGSQAHGISPDARHIVGWIPTSIYNSPAAVIWAASGPLRLPRPAVTEIQTGYIWPIDAWAVSNDGRLFGTCLQAGGYGDHLACIVDGKGDVDTFTGGEIYAADEMNHAGTRLGPHKGPTFKSVATLNSQSLGYPIGSNCFVPHMCESAVRAFSAGAAVLVGTSNVPAAGEPAMRDAPLFQTAFVYTKGEGMVRLLSMGNEGGTEAFAVDASGRVIGGSGPNRLGDRAAIVWVNRKPRNFAAVLEQAEIFEPVGWYFSEIKAVSADGLTFAGNGVNPLGKNEAFWVRLPESALQDAP